MKTAHTKTQGLGRTPFFSRAEKTALDDGLHQFKARILS